MIIETLDDWNAINTGCGCCGMPECPVPVMECESISLPLDCYLDMSLWAGTDPDIPSEDLCMRFGRMQAVNVIEAHREDDNGYTSDEVTSKSEDLEAVKSGVSCEEVFTRSDYDWLKEVHDVSPSNDRVWHDYWFFDKDTACSGRTIHTDSGSPGSDYDESYGCATVFTDYRALIGDNSLWAYTSPGVFTYHYFIDTTDPATQVNDTYEDTVTVSFLDPFDAVTLAAKLAGMSFDDDANGTDCSAEMAEDGECEGMMVTARSSRARFKIPATWADQVTGLTVPFTGTYFKITYDIIEEPTGWDDAEPTVFRSFFLEDQVLTPWIGPGTGAPDDPSWFTDWITLDPPSVPGIRRIVNIRFVCRENWFVGVVPQTTGDAVELPDP